MARAYQQSQPFEALREQDGNDWQSLRHELVALLDQVDSQVARSRGSAALGERVQDLRHQLTERESERHRDALRSVQRAIHRFEEPAPQPANPRDSLQAAINQIRSRQSEPARPAPAQAPERPLEAGLVDRLAGSVNGLSSRLERLEGEIRAQIKTGANVKDVADQVAQLAHVVELLAGAVGESGQVKRLEGQIASLGRIIAQGRELDVQSVTRRLDDVAATVGKLAELQVHYADRVQNPVETQAFQDGMRSIEASVRAVYDRIDSLERQRLLTPQDLEHVTAQMARFTEAVQDGAVGSHGLVELVDALNSRLSDMESGDRLVQALRKDLSALRDAVTLALTPRFDALEERMSSLSTRDDMAEIGRQIDALSEQFETRSHDPGIGQLEAQVRQLVARMDQTGEQLNSLSKLYAGEATEAPDLAAMAELAAARAAEAVQRASGTPDATIAASIENLEHRIAAMLQSPQRDPPTDGFDGVQAGIDEVNERLKRLEASLMQRSDEPVAPRAEIASILDETAAEPPRPRDAMWRNPSDDAPLIDTPFPEPRGPVALALEAKNGPRKLHPGLGEDVPLADRYDDPPAPPSPPPGFEPDKVQLPPAPQPSAGFGLDADRGDAGRRAEVEPAPVSVSSRNTFIEAARRAAQRQQQAQGGSAAMATNSLIGRALARFQAGTPAQPEAPQPAAPEKPAKSRTRIIPQIAARPEPVPAPPTAPAADARESIEPAIAVDGTAVRPVPKESFLSRNSRVILLAAAVVAVALLTMNFVAQRIVASAPADATPAAPAATDAQTTGDISHSVQRSPLPDDASQPLPARVIPMAGSLQTAAIDAGAAQGFSATPAAMPSAFTPLAPAPEAETAADAAPTAAPPSVEPLQPAASPVKVDLPPDNVGPMDLRQAAADGDARAQFEVAAIYTEGRAVPQDYKAAATWYERAAAQGFAPAQYRLGSLYENGNGVSKDLNTARLWYERAAEAGNRMSMHNLAALYAGGQLGKQQFDAAAKWFEEAAKRGLTDSQFNLGMLYARGLGVQQSLAESYKWFGIAALSGDKDAAKARDDVARSLDADTVSRLSAEVTAFKPQPIDLKANFAPIGTWSKSFDAGETITSKDIVATVQKALGKLGYDPGTPDGVAGKKTADAIRAFEDATGMSETGQINPRLLAVLGSQPV